MTFLKVLEATKRRRTGLLAFGGKIFDLPEFFRHYHTTFNRKVLQRDYLQFCPNFFHSFLNLVKQLPSLAS